MKDRTLATLFFFALGVALLPAAGVRRQAAPAGKPDFSGTWVLNLQRCQLQFPSKLDSGTIIIEHRDPAFRFSRTFVVGGKEDALSFELTTDGREKIVKEPDRTTTSRMSWDGDVLVLDERIVLADGRAAINTVRYGLHESGRMLIAEEKFRGPVHKHDNVWVADRKN
jgi:hypothetical protein